MALRTRNILHPPVDRSASRQQGHRFPPIANEHAILNEGEHIVTISMLFSRNNVGLVMHQAAENVKGKSYITVITLKAIPVSLVSMCFGGCIVPMVPVAIPLRSPVSFKKNVSGLYLRTSPVSRAALPIKCAPGITWVKLTHVTSTRCSISIHPDPQQTAPLKKYFLN